MFVLCREPLPKCSVRFERDDMYEGVTMRLLCVLITALLTVADPNANVHLPEIASAHLPQLGAGDAADSSFARGD